MRWLLLRFLLPFFALLRRRPSALYISNLYVCVTSLPQTGAIVFTIRTYFTPITTLCADPYVPGRLASAIRSWGDDVSRYKGRERYGDVLLEYLDRRHEEQVREGLDMEREEETRRYPF